MKRTQNKLTRTLKKLENGRNPEQATKSSVIDKEELKACFEKAIPLLQEGGCLHQISLFLELVIAEKFPLRNIAFLAFLEVVTWFGNSTTTLMRYSSETKLFWRTGFQLFKGKSHTLHLCPPSSWKALQCLLKFESRRKIPHLSQRTFLFFGAVTAARISTIINKNKNKCYRPVYMYLSQYGPVDKGYRGLRPILDK